MKLDQPTILNTAITLLNEVGLNALSMRALANRLDVKAASLYFHFKNKDELLEIISDSISEKIYNQLQGQTGLDFFTIATVTRQELKRVRDSPQIFSITNPFTPYRSKLITIAIEVFTKMGVPKEFVTTAGNLGNNYVLSYVSDEQYFLRSAADPTNTPMVNNTMATEITSPIDLADPDKAFNYGLKVILAGFEAIK